MTESLFPSAIRATLTTGVVMGLILTAGYVWLEQTPPIWATAIICIALLVIVWFDFDHYRIPNWLSLPLIVAGLSFAFYAHRAIFTQHILGALAGYGLIWLLNIYWRKRRGVEGIGMGDAKLLGAAGAWLGILALPLVTLIASATALVTILLSVAVQSKPILANTRIPFGPFIAVGFWTIWIVHPVLRLAI